MDHNPNDCCEVLKTDLPITKEIAAELIQQVDDILDETARYGLPLDLIAQDAEEPEGNRQYNALANFLNNHAVEIVDLPEFYIDEVAKDTTVSEVMSQLAKISKSGRGNQEEVDYLRQRLYLARQRAVLKIFTGCDQAEPQVPEAQPSTTNVTKSA